MAPPQPLDLLLPTKLTPPQASAAWVPRPRILTRLGATPRTRLTLVVAPAGFGKTTLVAQWLLAHGCEPAPPVAWLTLDEHDQDPLRFLAYVVSAIRQAVPRAQPRATEFLRAPEAPPVYVVLQALLVDLAELPDGVTLVLDDYHAITAEPIHQAVAYLLRHLPDGCRVVITSRVDPPLVLARLHAERQVTEVRTTELRFEKAEAEALLMGLSGVWPEGEQLAELLAQTEGWALALQMAALLPRGGRQSLAKRGMSKHITEYLTGEVLAQQPPELQRAMLSLAVPERFCPGLCAELLGRPGDLARGEEIIDQLVRANLFVVPLDDGRCFRFHHLFRDLLLHRLRLAAGEAVVRDLHGRAARWFRDQGYAEDAVRHFLAAGDEDAAAAVVEAQGLPLAGEGANVARARFAALPPALVERWPGLTLIEAFLHSTSLNLPAQEASLQRLDGLLAAAGAGAALPWPGFLADRAMLLGDLRFWQGRPAEAITALAPTMEGPLSPLSASTTIYLGLAYVGDGRYEEGVRLLEAELAAAPAGPQDGPQLFRLLSICGMHLLAGRHDGLIEAARRAVQLQVEGPVATTYRAYGIYALGLGAYERNELEAAAAHFGAVAARRYYVSHTAYTSSLAALAAIAAATGDSDGAMAHVADLATFARESGSLFVRHQTAGCAARVALAAGDVAAALRAAEEIGPDIHLGLSVWFEAPQLTQARALIAAGSPAALQRAEAVLRVCIDQCQALHNTRLLIAALATHGLLRASQGRHEDGQAALGRAISLAAPGGFVRTFADLGPALAPLLRAVAARGIERPYIERVLRATERASPAALPLSGGAPPGPPIPELLTRRESEILGLLAARLADQEIADQLLISLHTVRKHTSTIYDKLGVHSRREAVAAAQALGLLAEAAVPHKRQRCDTPTANT